MAKIVVKTYKQLAGALVPANAGQTIEARPGTYLVEHPLAVPAGATLQGGGKMKMGKGGLPNGLNPAPHAVLRAKPSLSGDILTLGDGARIEGLKIEDVAGRGTPAGGNAVAILSTGPNETVSASIEGCELVNPNASGIGPGGPVGRGLVVVTRNPNPLGPPPPDEGATLRVTMTRSIIRSPGNGSAIFAINFAPRGRIVIRLERNTIGGGFDAAGGVSRADPVSGAEVAIFSAGNLYRSDGTPPAGVGWLLQGGSNPPPAALPVPFTSHNALRIDSRQDRIEGFAIGILAAGGSRPHDASAPGGTPGPVDHNRADLDLDGIVIVSGESDLVLLGARTISGSFLPGEDNHLNVRITNATGSGLRDNFYAHAAADAAGALAPPLVGRGNRLAVYGDLAGFVADNPSIDPPPDDEFFL